MDISHNFFILFEDNKAKLVNYKEKKEYHIRKEYMNQLIKLSSAEEEVSDTTKIMKDLTQAGVLVEGNDKPEMYIHYYSNIFHNLSKNRSVTSNNTTEGEWALEYIKVCERVAKEKFPERDSYVNYKKTIQLPVATQSEESLLNTLKERKTIREFFDESVTQQQLSNILYFSYGNVHKDEGEYAPFYRRTSPSGGCLQIIEPYVTIFNVDGIPQGLYWYDSAEHKLCLVREAFSYQDLRECLAGQFFANDCAFGIFMTANLEILNWKYKTERNYKVVFLEAGHFAQTSQLMSTSEDLQIWITGAMTESLIEEACKIDGVKKIPVFFTAFGKGRKKSMHSLMQQKLDSYVESIKD